MIRAPYLLARLRLREFIHGPASAALYLSTPMALLVIVGMVFSNGHPFERKTITLVGEPGPALSAALAKYPDVRTHRDADLAVALNKLRTRTISGVLVVSPTELVVGPRDELFGRGLQSVLPDGARLRIEPVPRWGYVHYLFPGLITITIIASGLIGMGYSMVRYRSNQFLKKLATTPLSRTTFIAAQLGSRTALVFAQIALMVIAGWLVFDLPLTVAGAAWMAALSLLGLFTFMGAGFILACAIKNEANMLDLINVLMMPIVFFSEIFFSVDALPAPLAKFAALLPSTQLVRMYRSVLLYGETAPSQLWLGVAILVAWTVVTFLVSVNLFKWHQQ